MDTRNYERQKNTGKNMKLWIILFSFFLTIFMGAMELPKIVKAAEPTISVKEINYLNSTITLQLNSRDTQVFYSNSQKKTWDIVEGKINSDNTITMDISWITPSSNYVITFKGNYSTGIATVVIPKQATNFRATYNKAQSTVSFSNEGTRTVQWRKKGSSTWKTVDANTIAKEMSYLYTNGATVVFRLAPTNGTSATDYGFRASNEATVIITKKTAAPSITVNGSRFLIAAKKGMAYRTVNSDGTETDWTSVGGTANLMLTDIAPQVMYSADSTEQKEVTLQFRANATSSSQISKIATIMVPVQEGPPNEDKYGISLKYTSSSTLALQVKAATSTMPFEYTVVKEGFDLDYQTAVWTPITANTAVSISKTQAPKGSHIYLRKKSTDASAGAAFTLASAEIDVTGGNGVLYPDAMVASSVTTLITTSGVCKIDNSSAYLTFTLYSPVETTVSAIDFYDSYGNKRGTVTSKSTVSANSKSTGVNDKYIITTKITSTESINNVTKEVLYAYITLANSEVIRSSQEAGILLYLYPNSKLNNPSEDNYTNDFKRIYESTD
ncbi:MAG TPA: hypothetical protein VN131_06925, partial [Mobilitalea sp.]|nr:hypothetical protein [Mobilitalea sp.]